MSFEVVRPKFGGRALDNDGGPPHDGDMEARIAKLEEFAADAKERLVKIESRLEQTATKADISEIRADMHKSSTDISRWMIATVISLFLGFAGLFFTMNNAVKAPSSQPAPVVITIPQPAPAIIQPPPKQP